MAPRRNKRKKTKGAKLDSFMRQCTDSWTCPLCAAKGVTSPVRLYQATDHQAIYFCESKGCIYPQNDESDPVLVNRPLLDLPVNEKTLKEFGFPRTLLNEGELTYRDLHKLTLIQEAYKELDDWSFLEKELKRLKIALDDGLRRSSSTTGEPPFNPQCTPLKYLREIPTDLIKYVKHFIPNIDEVRELLRMDML